MRACARKYDNNDMSSVNINIISIFVLLAFQRKEGGRATSTQAFREGRKQE